MNIGLLGAARITPAAIVAPAGVIPSAVLAGVAARDRGRAARFAAEHGVARTFEDYGELIAAPEIELIYNALPVNLHSIWSIAALRLGKHVICEKPLAMNADEVRAMRDAAAAGGARLFEAFHYRFHPAFDTLLDWVGRGRIGRVLAVEAHFDAPIRDDGREIRHRPANGGGAMMDLGCYPLSWILEVVAGEPVSIRADAVLTPSGVDESMRAVLEFADGVEARLSTSMAADGAVSAALRVVGDAGEITFDNPLAPHRGAVLRLSARDHEVFAPISRISTYTHQLAAVLDAIDAGTATPMEGERLLRQQRALDAVYAAAGLSALRQRPDSA